MSSWASERLCAFDLETDGPEPLDARIITASVLLLGGGQDRADRTWLVKPERPIPAAATDVHGITTEHAEQHGADRREAAGQIAGLLTEMMLRGTPVVAFNASYDFTVLTCECARLGLPALSEMMQRPIGPILDPHVIDKQLDRYRRGKRTLTATCETYGIEIGDAHDSTADALAAARLMYKLAVRMPHVGAMALDELHAAQVEWRREQSASLQVYLRKSDPAAVVDGGWPLQGGA